LPSVGAARRFAKEGLAMAAQRGDKTIIVTRQAASWKLPKADNIVVYQSGLTRGASLGPNTPGGKAILSRYDLA
jgi:hypothetical protein